tara:strand:- start:1698 stop:2879 length:1182 start_codon:yes stop_codon:yes gene_type:complete
MKSFRDFTAVRKEVKDQGIRDQYYREEIYKEGEWVLTEKGHVGKIIRRGPNYLICLTAEETKFRTWVKDVKEVFEIGTDAHRQYVMSLTPGQKVQKPAGTVAVKQTIPTDPKKDKMDNHESLVQAAVKALNEYSPVPPVKKTPVGTEGTANKNPKGTGGAKGVGGGDAPGMKMAEPKGTKGKPTIKKPKHACATKVEHPEWGAGNCLKEQHTLDEEGTVTHYDVMFDHGLEQNVSINELNVTLSEYHEHAINDTKNKEVLDEKKAKKDHDGDGKIESGKDEYFGSRDKAIKKAMGKKAMKKEHHEKDNDGRVIAHDKSDDDKDKTLGKVFDTAPSSVEEASLATARKNIGRDPKKPSCWKGYKAKGTKMKGGKSVPNCVKEFAEWRKEVTEKK